MNIEVLMHLDNNLIVWYTLVSNSAVTVLQLFDLRRI